MSLEIKQVEKLLGSVDAFIVNDDVNEAYKEIEKICLAWAADVKTMQSQTYRELAF